eukprot:2005779-Lingulodinium_polyedra.AAC.1
MAAGCQVARANPGGGRCISAEIKIHRTPVRSIDEPEATVFGDAGRRCEYRVHAAASDQHAALAWIH